MEDEEGDEEVPELCFRERAEKSTGGEVVLLEWSPTMDILALALSDHSVSCGYCSQSNYGIVSWLVQHMKTNTVYSCMKN